MSSLISNIFRSKKKDVLELLSVEEDDLQLPMSVVVVLRLQRSVGGDLQRRKNAGVLELAQELQRDVVVLVEPLHDESLKPGGVLWDLALVGWDVCHVGFVQPLDPEVAVEVGGGLAESVLLVLLKRVLHVRGEEAPDGGG